MTRRRGTRPRRSTRPSSPRTRACAVARDAAEPEADPALAVRDLCEAPFLRIRDARSEHVVERDRRRLAQCPEDVVGGGGERELHGRHDDPAAGDVGRVRRLVRSRTWPPFESERTWTTLHVFALGANQARNGPSCAKATIDCRGGRWYSVCGRGGGRRRMQDGGRESERREHRSHRLQTSQRVLGPCVRRGFRVRRGWYHRLLGVTAATAFPSPGDQRALVSCFQGVCVSVELRPDELQRLVALDRKFAKEGLTFDDVLLVPAESRVLPNDVSTRTRLTPVDRAEHPDRLGGDGHGHRGAPRDRARPRGRHRHHPPQPVDRGAGRRGRQGEALRVGDDRRAGHAAARRARPRGARADGALQDLRRPDHRRRRRARRDPDEPRPPLRGRRRAAGVGADDVAQPRHRARRHDARRGGGDPPPEQDREAARRRRRRPAPRAHHRQGHPEADRVSGRDEGRARPAARRRRGRRRARRGRARAGARRGRRRRARRRHRARPLAPACSRW